MIRGPTIRVLNVLLQQAWGARLARAVLRFGRVSGLLVVCSCANQGAPSGGPIDRAGPQVVETSPDTFAVVAPFDDAIQIVFNERISERAVRGTLDDAVIVSPQSGEVRVRHSSRALRVTMAGGIQPNEVYRVTVQPFVQDLFRNPMADAFEFIFSTGAEMTPTVLAGSVIDRITGQPVRDARVLARVERPPEAEEEEPDEDQVIPAHVAVTDSAGVYAFRYVPAGRYVITAFEDQNRSREPDGTEPVGTGLEELNAADTVLLNLSLLLPDTTPAMVQNVDVIDSLTLVVELDDFLDPPSDLTGVSASLGPDSLAPPGVVTIMHERDYFNRMDAIQDSLHVADSIQFDEETQRIEALRAAGDSVTADEVESELTTPRPPAQSDARVLQDRDLPKRTLFLLLADTLATDQAYELSVEGVTNINGVPGGGGMADSGADFSGSDIF